MQETARLQTVIEFLTGLNETGLPADRFMQGQWRLRRYAGSKDRAAVAERFFTILRQRAHLSWRMGVAPMGPEAPRALTIGALLAEGKNLDEVEALFSGSGYGPSALTDAERAVIATTPADMPAWMAGEYPEWLEGDLEQTLGGDLPVAMAAMQDRAGIDLRVNSLKATRDQVQALLAEEGYPALPTPYSPHGLRLPGGGATTRLSALKAFQDGWFEFQDEAAQLASMLCAARPGIRLLDLAAGAGGKSLALAAIMANEGQIVAYDIIPDRLNRLAARATRAGVTNIHTAEEEVTGRFDVVLVDAPCSGTGTWRRQPELRWRLTPERLVELKTVQSALLDRAAGLTAAGGRLVYATCSLLPGENDDQVADFLARHEGWSVRRADQVWAELAQTAPAGLPPGMLEFFHAAPHTTGTDGFFTAILQAPA
ncbi:MAG: RsmB/NOP family class I SAM-dependent RNA methyltransferase [Rhizomicrobium sp.]